MHTAKKEILIAWGVCVSHQFGREWKILSSSFVFNDYLSLSLKIDALRIVQQLMFSKDKF